MDDHYYSYSESYTPSEWGEIMREGELHVNYNFTLWKQEEGPQGQGDVHHIVRYYSQSEGHYHLSQELQVVTREVKSKCNDECKPGQMKKSQEYQFHSCCYDCIDCPPNY